MEISDVAMMNRIINSYTYDNEDCVQQCDEKFY